jgi:hypothetical protein
MKTPLLVGIAAAVLVAARSPGSGPHGRGDHPPATPAQSGVVRLRVIGEESGVEWFGVRGAAYRGDELVVVTRPAPAVHVFAGPRHQAWGRTGSGPAELRDPMAVTLSDDRVLVYDMQLGKIASYSRTGTFVQARSVGVLNGVNTTGRDTVVGSAEPTSGMRRVLRLRGTRVDTLFEYRVSGQIRLTAPGSPSYTVTPPYAAVPQWAALPGGRVAIWDAGRPRLVVRSLSGEPSVAFPLSPSRYRVSAQDRDLWLNEAIPTEFMGQRVFEPIRAAARRTVSFPDFLPPVLAILGDPSGGAWVRQTTSATGETWTLVNQDGPHATFRLPPGRKLLAVGQTEIAAVTRDEDEVESVEIYRKPATALPARRGR